MIFKACRTNKVDVFQNIFEQIGSAEHLLPYIHKKDPEGRNPIVLCLLNASPSVLEALHDTLRDQCDMNELILSQKYDSCPAFILALSLQSFEKYKTRVEQTFSYMINLMFKQGGKEPSLIPEYQRHLNAQDRLGRTCAHLLFSSNMLNEKINFYINKCQLALQIEDIDGQTPLDYAVQYNIPAKVQFKTETKEDVEHLLRMASQARDFGSKDVLKHITETLQSDSTTLSELASKHGLTYEESQNETISDRKTFVITDPYCLEHAGFENYANVMERVK